VQVPSTSYPGVSYPQGYPAAVPPPQRPAPPPNVFQAWMIRVFSPSLASNPILGIIAGSLLAVIVGVLISVIFVSIASGIAPHFGIDGAFPAGQDALDASLGFYSLRSSFKDGLQLFFIMHGAANHIQFAYSNSSSSNLSTFNASFNSLLSGLLLIPALLLTLGGYVAACTDFQNRPLSSLWRGAAISVPYAILLVILTSQVNGSSITLPLQYDQNGAVTLTPTFDGTSLFLFGLLWGAIFGVLGASIKLSRGQWRHMVFQYLRANGRARVTGMIAGALAASGLGIALSLLFVLGFLAFSTYSIPLFTHNLCDYNFGYGDWQIVTAWGIAQGPLMAANLFFYSFGAPFTVNVPQAIGDACFFTGNPHTTHLALSMFGGTPHLPQWTYALLLIPVVSLFLGGRVSAAIARPRGVGPAAVQGALVAVPFVVLMMLLTTITSISTQETAFGSSSVQNIFYTLTAGVGAFDLVLWALLFGVVLGALGGAYQASSLRTGIAKVLRGLIKPLGLITKPFFSLIDRFTGRPVATPRSAARSLVYGALLWALLLLVAVGVASIILIANNQVIELATIYRVRDILSVLLVALPGLFLISAAASALVTDPQGSQITTTAPAPGFQVGYSIPPGPPPPRTPFIPGQQM
jgi:hypothetical protein